LQPLFDAEYAVRRELGDPASGAVGEASEQDGVRRAQPLALLVEREARLDGAGQIDLCEHEHFCQKDVELLPVWPPPREERNARFLHDSSPSK